MDLAQKPVYKLDLAAGTSVVNLTTPLVEGDDRAQTFTLELTDKGAPANLDGYSVTAYFGRGKTAEAEADTIPLSGTVSGNVATITLTESCYSRSCYFSMPIRLSNGVTGQKRTYLIVRGTVVKSVDGKIIDPDGSVPSLDDLFAQIAVMERSRQAAEEATEEAMAAAARADEAREGIQGDLAALTEDMGKIATISPNLFDKSKAVKGGYYNVNNGQIVAYEYGYTCLIPVSAGTYTFGGAGGIFGSTVAKVPVFDASGNYVKTITGASGDKVGNATLVTYTISADDVASGVAFAGFTANDYTINTAMYVKGADYPDEYQPYGEVTPSDALKEALTSDPAVVSNALYGKIVAFDGDSICVGASAKDGLSGWAGRIGTANAMDWKNYGIGGGTITAGLYMSEDRPRHWISRNIDTIHAEMPELDYLILEGGTNDADLLNESTQMGTFDLGDFSGVYDDTTFCGALETLFYKAVTYYPQCKIGYIVAHRMGYNQYTSDYDTTGSKRYRYFVKAMEICKKWGIPYLNLWDTSHMNPKLPSMFNQMLDVDGNIEGGYLYTDGQHLTPAGYELITPMIEAWMRTL